MTKSKEGGKGGVVVNLSSIAGITCAGASCTIPAYVASKHAVTGAFRVNYVDFNSSEVRNIHNID